MFGTRLVQLIPVSGSPVLRTINLDSHSTEPWPAKSVSRQPVRVLPSKNETQPSPSKGSEGLDAASFRLSVGACRVAAGAAGSGSGVDGLGGLEDGDAQPATMIHVAEIMSVIAFIRRLSCQFCAVPIV